jgi:hypothetical protein
MRTRSIQGQHHDGDYELQEADGSGKLRAFQALDQFMRVLFFGDFVHSPPLAA